MRRTHGCVLNRRSPDTAPHARRIDEQPIEYRAPPVPEDAASIPAPLPPLALRLGLRASQVSRKLLERASSAAALSACWARSRLPSTSSSSAWRRRSQTTNVGAPSAGRRGRRRRMGRSAVGERDPLHRDLAIPSRELLRQRVHLGVAVGGDDHSRGALTARRHVQEQPDRRPVGPVPIMQHEQERPPSPKASSTAPTATNSRSLASVPAIVNDRRDERALLHRRPCGRDASTPAPRTPGP
jgi:hypothetical protein